MFTRKTLSLSKPNQNLIEMKRHAISSILLLVFSVAVFAQETGPLTTQKKGLKKTYLNEGNPIAYKDLGNLLQSNPSSEGAYKAYKTNAIIGQSVMIGGTALLGVGLVYEIMSASAVNEGDLSKTDEYSKTAGTFLISGAVVMLGSLPFYLMASSNFNKSINLYNSEMRSRSGKAAVIMDLYLTGNGAKICLKF